MRALPLCYTALFTALIAVCSWICLPLGEIKYTLQLLAVLVCGGVLGIQYGFLSVFAYLLLGAVGVPVFSGFTAGILSTPTSGFLIGFLLTVILVGVGYRITLKNSFVNLLIHVTFMILGVIMCYVFGILWFMLYTSSGEGVTFFYAFGVCVLPYVWFDCVKIVLALFFIDRLKKIVK